MPGFSPPTSAWTFSCAHDFSVSFNAFSFPGHLLWKPSFLLQHTQGPGARVSAPDWTITELYLYSHDIAQTFGSMALGGGEGGVSMQGLVWALHQPPTQRGKGTKVSASPMVQPSLGYVSPLADPVTSRDLNARSSQDQLRQRPASGCRGLEHPDAAPFPTRSFWAQSSFMCLPGLPTQSPCQSKCFTNEQMNVLTVSMVSTTWS